MFAKQNKNVMVLEYSNSQSTKKKTMTHQVDPIIKLSDALAIHNGKQSALADDLELSRSVVCEWVASEREFVPPLHAHRLVKIHPEIPVQEPENECVA